MKLSHTFKKTPSLDIDHLARAQKVKQKAESNINWATRLDDDVFDEDRAPDSVKVTALRGGSWETGKFKALPDGGESFEYQKEYLIGGTESQTVEHRPDGTSVYKLENRDPWYREKTWDPPKTKIATSSAVFETSTGTLIEFNDWQRTFLPNS